MKYFHKIATFNDYEVSENRARKYLKELMKYIALAEIKDVLDGKCE